MDTHQRKFILAIAGAFLAGTVFGYGTGFFQGKKTLVIPPRFSPASQIFSLSGKAGEIKENILLMEARIFADSGETVFAPREIIITERTKVYETKLKSLDELAAELREYQEAAAQGEARSPAPLVKIGKELTIGDIEQGGEIIVESAENIKLKTRFEATRIMIQKFQ